MKRNTLVFLGLLCTAFIMYSCSKELSFEKNIYSISAEGSLWDSTDNCLPRTVYGTYYNGVAPGDDTAYVEVQVDVTVPGSYHISTDLQNGFIFSDSGFFSATGVNTIRLKPAGTPILFEPTTFTFSFDSTVCGFIINVEDSTGKGFGGFDTTTTPIDSTNLSDTAWKFSVGASTYHGQIDTAFVLDTLGLQYLTLVGSTASGDTAFLAGILISGTITPGTYTTGFQAGLYLTTITPPSTPVTIYQADATTATPGTVTITILSYDSVTGVVTGTFSGTAVDGSGNAATITNGSFKAKVT